MKNVKKSKNPPKVNSKMHNLYFIFLHVSGPLEQKQIEEIFILNFAIDLQKELRTFSHSS